MRWSMSLIVIWIGEDSIWIGSRIHREASASFVRINHPTPHDPTVVSAK